MKWMNWAVMTACMGLFACGGPADEVADDGYEDEAYTDDGYYEEEDEGVFEPMVDSIDRAEAVQDLNMDRKNRMDVAIEGSE